MATMINYAKSLVLDHLGLVASVISELGIDKKIDARLPVADRANVSMGQRASAMILNGLGFMNDRLYLVPRFFHNKPVGRLICPGVQAEHLNDDTLGRFLDAVADYGTSRLFGEIAFEIGHEQGLLGRSAHLDTTTLSLYGDYQDDRILVQEQAHADISAAAPLAIIPCDAVKESIMTSASESMTGKTSGDSITFEPTSSPISITYGNSKAHRPDLKQVVLSLTTTGSAGFPIWFEALDGNRSDKASFHETRTKVSAFQEQLEGAPPFLWVADSALYSIDKLLSLPSTPWVTRVPHTVGAAKSLVEMPKENFDWVDIGNGYQMVSIGCNYGGALQRWLLVYSEQAFKREHPTFEKNLKKLEDELKKKIWHLSNRIFSDKSVAEQIFRDLNKAAKYHNIDYDIKEICKHSGRGRPKSGQTPCIVGYSVNANVSQDDDLINVALNSKGRFILATSCLDDKELSDVAVFQEYKEQSQVEGGFRFLKDPWFMVDSVFLKSPKRIEALMMVMTLSLMVYNVGQHKLRKQLEAKGDTLPNQVGKPIKNPTLRWIFRVMEGITIVTVMVGGMVGEFIQTLVCNLDVLREKIIRYFGKRAMEIYGLT